MEEKCGRILVADDNEELCRMIETILTAEGYRHVTYVLSCEEAEKLLRQESFDLLVLDVNFPGEDGFSFFARLRQTRDIPVLFLSARDQSGDKLRGLGLGADDYMTKPFLPKELALRIGAILRRTCRKERQPRIFQVGNREVDLDAGLVRFREKGELRELSLTNKEYQLLKLFLENRGRILTLDVISETVWGENYYGFENTLMVHIRKLREKIEENPSAPRWLITVKGLGYRLNQ